MAQPTYSARVIVLRKTKLGESDLILTMLAEDGSQVRAVAKGARKPASPFAARLELYSVADVLLAHGRSLDIVKEARLTEGNAALRLELERSAGAAAAAELIGRITQLGLENPRLFGLTRAGLAALGDCERRAVPALTAAHLLKALAFAGFRPNLSSCAVCGRDMGGALAPGGGDVSVSYREGGVVCGACRLGASAVRIPASTLAWVNALLHATFAEVGAFDIGMQESFGALRFCQQWVREHIGSDLKSLTFLFTCGLF